MLESGQSGPLGATIMRDGVNFALFSSSAEAVELCLFDEAGHQVATHFLPEKNNDVWHGFLPGCRVGQRYGYRVHGPWNPARGQRHNPAKLLLDPYARRLSGHFTWDSALYDYRVAGRGGRWVRCEHDSAGCVPRCVVAPAAPSRMGNRPSVPWSSAVIYEANVRGYTMRHPGLSDKERGRFRGMSNGQILEYLKALGITSLELMPVHSMLDEEFLIEKGLRNLWGYNSVQFFTPEARLAGSDPVGEFLEMVEAIHDAGIEVILDVVYNHTAEGGGGGPTLSLRGIDNLAYYRTEPGHPGHYINDTGCGNTLNTDHIRTQNLVLDSLRYWHRSMGVDGFRFDLATVLGRTPHGFSKPHSLLNRIGYDPELEGAKLIAEPWDPGPGGYQLGRFPNEWAEWNDRYRDSVRRFWRGDADQDAEFARRIHGSADLFESSGRNPASSINYVACHDGFTLADVVSYEKRYNLANGEDNRDGQEHNYSANYGVEGPSDDPQVNRIRRQQRLNMLATLLFSQGTPMIFGGDEFGNSQAGNNNAYAQDNETGWVDWSGLEADPAFHQAVCELLRLRREIPLLRQARYVHGRIPTDRGWCDIGWQHPDGRPMRPPDWNSLGRLALVFSVHAEQKVDSPVTNAVAILFNATAAPVEFALPYDLPGGMVPRFSSAEERSERVGSGRWSVAARSLLLLVSEGEP